MNRIRELRLERSKTMKELGVIIGVSESTISLYENEKREPDLKTLVKFADYFDVSVDYLLGRTSERHSREEPEQITSPLLASLLHSFDQLNQEGRERIVEQADDMVQSGKYKKVARPEMGSAAG